MTTQQQSYIHQQPMDGSGMMMGFPQQGMQQQQPPMGYGNPSMPMGQQQPGGSLLSAPMGQFSQQQGMGAPFYGNGAPQQGMHHQSPSPNAMNAPYGAPMMPQQQMGAGTPLQSITPLSGPLGSSNGVNGTGMYGAPANPMFYGTPTTHTNNNNHHPHPHHGNGSANQSTSSNNNSHKHSNSSVADPATCANVFVASLPNFYDDKMLLELFQPFGAIISAKVSRDLVTGNSRSFGFVRFELPESAQRAIADLHNAKVKGAGTSKLHVTLSNHSENESSAECDRLYVRNLPLSATTESLVAIFSAFGTVLEANIHGNGRDGQARSEGQGKGAANMAVGFVRMSTVEEARQAMLKVHNTRPLDPDSPILVRFMETPDMKAARRGKTKDTEGASGRNSANRNSPDHLSGPNVVSNASGSRPGSPYIPSPHQQQQQGPMGGYGTGLGMGMMVQAPVAMSAPFPSYGDLYMLGASSEAIARYVFNHAGYTVAMLVNNGPAHFVRLADPLQHERAAGELNNVVLSDGNTLKVVTLVPPAAQQPQPVPQQQQMMGNGMGMGIIMQSPPQQMGASGGMPMPPMNNNNNSNPSMGGSGIIPPMATMSPGVGPQSLMPCPPPIQQMQ